MSEYSNSTEDTALYGLRLVRFAEELAARSERRLILLEHHGNHCAVDLLLHPPASAILEGAGLLDFCSELESKDKFSRLKPVTPETLFAKGDPIKWMPIRMERLAHIIHNRPFSKINFHAVGNDRIFIEEVREDLRAKGQTMLLDKIFTEPIQSAEGRSVTRDEFISAVFAVLMSVESPLRENAAQNLLLTAARAKKSYVLMRVLQDRDNGAKLSREFQAEANRVAELGHHYRRYGKTDQTIAKNVLQLAPARSIVNIGYIHGVYANNPASLPDQLAAQSGDASMKIIWPIDRAFASKNYLGIHQERAQNKLRHDLFLYDFEDGELLTVDAWLSKNRHLLLSALTQSLSQRFERR